MRATLNPPDDNHTHGWWLIADKAIQANCDECSTRRPANLPPKAARTNSKQKFSSPIIRLIDEDLAT